MHPGKAEEAIAEAYLDHGVRTFSLDSREELDKIVRATNGATDLTLCVRLRVSSDYSKLSLAAKFGVGRSEEHTSELQSLMRTSCAAFGLNKKQKVNITCLII